jgi:hypothetical protein
VHHHHWWHVDTAISGATNAICQALRAGTWIPGQQRRLRQLAPGTWQQALAGVLAVSPASQTTTRATPSSRSRSTPTSSGSPRAASGRTTPAIAPHP